MDSRRFSKPLQGAGKERVLQQHISDVHTIGFDTQAEGYFSKPDGPAESWLEYRRREGGQVLHCLKFGKLIRALVNAAAVLCVMRQY